MSAATQQVIAPAAAASLNLFGIEFCGLTFDQAVAFFHDRACAGEGLVAFTANVDHIVRRGKDPEFARLYQAANVVFADGTPVVWSAKLLRRPVHRVPGIDLLYACLRLAGENGHRCFFLGARPDTLSKAIAIAEKTFPGLRIAGSHHGYFQDPAPVLSAIAQATPHFIFVGMGSPRQERWIAENSAKIGSAIILPVGGSFEVLAGEKSRAPKFIQQVGMEWVWRMLQDPQRLWKRYLVEDLPFLGMLLREMIRSVRSMGPAQDRRA
ncbi:MAG TPA: WecB/TagA/CpsF family glycosyltransferase [Candidatus Limnocylindrales bacterium]|nr:WecB/TagA/CpsF family glycosyltransferase [Candidatus Limnocylindrales bacterium]